MSRTPLSSVGLGSPDPSALMVAGCHLPGYCLTFLGTNRRTGKKEPLPRCFRLACAGYRGAMWDPPAQHWHQGRAVLNRGIPAKKKKKKRKEKQEVSSFSQLCGWWGWWFEGFMGIPGLSSSNPKVLP